MMNIARIIQLAKHPEQQDRETLYELRNLLERYPYFAAARIVYLTNLYKVGDPSFRSEVARVAFSINDRTPLFQAVEGARYAPAAAAREFVPAVSAGDAVGAAVPADRSAETDGGRAPAVSPEAIPGSSRTIDLINRFLAQQPDASYAPSLGYEGMVGESPLLLELSEQGGGASAAVPDSTGDESREEVSRNGVATAGTTDDDVQKKERSLSPAGEGISSEEQPHPVVSDDADGHLDESYFTETLAKIYVKQGRYEKALEIIKAISLKNPKKNAYFADQIRFLRKLIINSSK